MTKKLTRIKDEDLDLLLNHAVKVTNPMLLDEVMIYAKAVRDAQLAHCQKEHDWFEKAILIIISDFEDELAKDEGLSPLDLADRIKHFLGGDNEFDPQAALFGRFIELGWTPPEEHDQAVKELLQAIGEGIVSIILNFYAVDEPPDEIEDFIDDLKEGKLPKALKRGKLPEGMVK